MRSKIAQRIINETPEDVKIFVRKYGDIVVRVHQILREKGISQKELAEKLGKSPSEISKWLAGDHNFTLRSLTKLESELGVDLIYIPKKDSFHVQISASITKSVPPQKPLGRVVEFTPASEKIYQQPISASAS